MKRNFNDWLSTFTWCIFNYHYYIDFESVYRNLDAYKDELNLLYCLIGSPKPDEEFKRLVSKFPSVLKCIPILLAKRENDIYAADENGEFTYHFNEPNQSVDQYCYFMQETGLFDLFQKHLTNSVIDYVTGVEAGLNSNARKNRGGDQMEDLVESYIKKLGVEYHKEMYLSEIEQKWGFNLSSLSNAGKATKRFDFVIYAHNHVYAIETNFYGGGGSKLNEVARSYKELTQESTSIPNFSFVWITDGAGWQSAKNNLEETFDVLETLYNIHDLKDGALKKLIG
jgi:type II restriction enzyme